MDAGTLVDGRYRVVAPLAEGGMSVVYEVEDTRLSGRLALKVMRELVAGSDVRQQLEEQFQHEAELLAGQTHANLPRVTDFFVWEGRRCLVQELVPGQTLEDACQGHLPRDEAEVLAWALQICDALEYLHAHQIIYRDLKPSNCVLTPTNQVKLIDFGIARVFALGKARDTVLMGTPGFAAPEQYGRDQSDPRADIFALGVLLHYLLTGRDPALTPFVFEPIEAVNSDVSAGTVRAIAKALSLEPARRFQTVAEFREALATGHLPVEGGEYFAYPESVAPKLSTYVGSALAVVVIGALGVLSLCEQTTWMYAGAFAGAYAPAWTGLIWREKSRRQDMARSWFRVQDDGLNCGGHIMAWNDVETIRYRRDTLSGCGMVDVVGGGKSCWFVSEASPSSGFKALNDAERLCRVLERRARKARVERPRF